MVKHIKTTNEFDSIIRENHIVIVDGKSVGNIVGAREKEIFVKDIENLLK